LIAILTLLVTVGAFIQQMGFQSSTQKGFPTAFRTHYIIKLALAAEGIKVFFQSTQLTLPITAFVMKFATNSESSNLPVYVLVYNGNKSLHFTHGASLVSLSYFEDTFLTEMVATTGCKMRVIQKTQADAALVLLGEATDKVVFIGKFNS
jgi:hypothetical protein